MESFNHVILNFRGKPNYPILEDIRKLVNEGLLKRFERAQSWEGKVIPFVKEKLKLIV